MIISIWTEELCAKLSKMWAEGFSCELIGRELGVTRNAVIGKAHRLKLEGRAVTTIAVKREPKPKQIKQQVIRRASHNALTVRVDRIERAEHQLRCVEIKCETPFDDVTGCWWPSDVDVLPFLFCNGPRMANRRYCVSHYHLSLRDLPVRRAA